MIRLIEIQDAYVIRDKKVFQLSSPEDAAGLPTATKQGTGINGYCSAGSFAYTTDLEHIYHLDADGETWIEI